MGMGTFLYVVIAQFYEQFHSQQDRWSEYVAKHLLPRLHGFEVLMPAYLHGRVLNFINHYNQQITSHG